MNNRGSVPLFVAGIIPAVLFTGVFTAEATRYWLNQARLQAALDAGALYAAANLNRPDRDANVQAIVAANYNENATGGSHMSASNVQVQSIGTDRVQVSASAGFSTLTASTSILGSNNPLTKKTSIGGSAVANQTRTGLELALVFDITLSMTAKDVGNNQMRIEAARDAGLQLLKVLYGDTGTDTTKHKKWAEHLYISVIPFATAVNYGAANTHFLAAARPSDNYRTSWSGQATSWGGCAEMRDPAFLDRSPQDVGLTRFFAPSTWDPTKKYDKDIKPGKANYFCGADARYRDDRKDNPSGADNVCMGHNDWTAPRYVFDQKQNTLINSMVSWSSHVIAGINPWTVAHGPNMMCPPETLRVLPLTRDRATVESRIRAVASLPFSAGTNIAPGLQAGWFTLSPNWRRSGSFAGWPSAEPAADANDPRPTLPSLPLDYHLQNRQKVLILLTDGDNTWFNARNFQGDGSTLVRPESARQEGFYGAYGNLNDQLDATSISDGVSKINTESVRWCEMIRARRPAERAGDPPGPEQVTIYTISFSGSVSGAAQTVLQNCASKKVDGVTPQHYHAPDAAKLREVFTAIGNELAKLRLSQ